MKAQKSPPKRILIVQTAFIGDVILTLPLLQEVKSHFPDAAVDFIAIPSSKSILENNPLIDYLYIYDKRQRDKGITAYLRLIKRLRGRRYDLALVPHRSIRSAGLVFAAKIPRRIGFDKSSGRFLFNTLLPYPRNIHEINRNLRLLTPLGIDADKKVFPEMHFSREDETAVQNWLVEKDLGGNRKCIAFAPGSVWATKRWLPEHFAGLAKRLTNKGFHIILIGSAQDQEATAMIAADNPKVHDAAGQFTLRQSALLIQQCHALVTNDSSPLHLAVSVGTPVIAIFGATIPAFGFYPYGDNDRVVEVEGLSCRPCGIHGGNSCPIKTFDCMVKITPERIEKELEALLSTEK